MSNYTDNAGTMAARRAIVEKYATPEYPFAAEDVFLTFGC
jgi:tyrosine aminotransferase